MSGFPSERIILRNVLIAALAIAFFIALPSLMRWWQGPPEPPRDTTPARP